MAKIIIPGINPVKYVPYQLSPGHESLRLDDRYNFLHIPASHEANTRYAQKWVKSDPIRQQIWSQNVALLFIQIVNCSGSVVNTVYPSSASLLNYIVNDQAWNINQFEIDTAALPAGTYYFILHYGQTEETLVREISEPQLVVTELPESVLFKYSHSYNEYNTIFKTSYNSFFNQTFYFRVEGRATDKVPEGNFVDYEDQKLNKTLLSAKPFDSWLFKIGGKAGVPEWVGTVLNFIRSCDTVYVDEYNISFADKWEKQDVRNYRQYLYTIRFRKAVIEFAREIAVCEPVSAEELALPDANQNQPYIYTHQLTGNRPFTIKAISKPSWMGVFIIDDIMYFQTIGLQRPTTPATGVAVSITIENPCGEIELTDTINVIAQNACVPVAFTGSNVLPPPVYGQVWNAFIGLSGSTPYTLTNVSKPAWLTVTAVSNGIQLSGTPTLAGSFNVGFSIQNCAGAGAAITYSNTFTVTSNVAFTGFNELFSSSRTFQSGQILAAPGTLITIDMTAQGEGPIPPNQYQLAVTLYGASPSVPLVVQNGDIVATFVMPASGFVGWAGVYTGTNNLGYGDMAVY